MTLFRAEELGYLNRCRALGDVEYGRFGPKPVSVLYHPDREEELLVTHHPDTIQGEGAGPPVVRPLLGKGPGAGCRCGWSGGDSPRVAPRTTAVCACATHSGNLTCCRLLWAVKACYGSFTRTPWAVNRAAPAVNGG